MDTSKVMMFAVWLALAVYCLIYPFYSDHSYSPSFISVVTMSVSVLVIWFGMSKIRYFADRSAVKLSITTVLLLPFIYFGLIVVVGLVVKDVSAMALSGVSEARFVTFHLPVVASVVFLICWVVQNLIGRVNT